MRFFTMNKEPKTVSMPVDGQYKLLHLHEMTGYMVNEMSDLNDPKQLRSAMFSFACRVAIMGIMDAMNVEHSEAADIFWRGQNSRAREMVESLRVGIGSTTMVMKDPKTGDTVVGFCTNEELIERSV